MKPFVKYVNVRHVFPTRYVVDIDLKKAVDEADLVDPERKIDVKKGLKKLFHDRYLLEAIDTFRADGVVYHPIKSCRTVSTSLADSRRVVLAERDVLCLYIESDMMDKRVVSEAQLKNRIDAFFEGLESRRIRRSHAGADAAAPAPTA